MCNVRKERNSGRIKRRLQLRTGCRKCFTRYAKFVPLKAKLNSKISEGIFVTFSQHDKGAYWG